MSTQDDKQYFKSGIMTFVFIYSFNRFSYYFQANRKVKREIKKLQSIPIKNPSDILPEAKQQGKTNLYFVEGVPIKGKLVSSFKNIPLILRIKQKDPLFSLDSLQEPKIKFNWREAQLNSDCVIDREPFFALQDKFNKESINVAVNDNTNIETALTSFGFKDQKRSLSFAEHIGNFATIFYSSLIKILGPAALIQVLFRDSTFKGVHIGYRDNEFGIRAEGLLSVLGQATYDTVNKKLTLDNPLALTISKSSYIYFLEKKSTENKVAFNFWLIISFLSGLYLSRRIFLYNKKHPKYWQKVKQFFQKLFKKTHRKGQIDNKVIEIIKDDVVRAQEQGQESPTQLQ